MKNDVNDVWKLPQNLEQRAKQLLLRFVQGLCAQIPEIEVNRK